MTNQRAREIVNAVLYKQIKNIADTIDDPENAFHVGRYIGMMQKDLENELAKEVRENEHDGE